MTRQRVVTKRAAEDLLIALGADLDSARWRDPPRRMVAAYATLLTPEPCLMTSPSNEGHQTAGRAG